MFNFVINKNATNENCKELILKIEKKYNIVFPDIMKDYYMNHDGEKIKHCNIGTEEEPEIVSGIVSLSNNDFESTKEEFVSDGFIPLSFYPIAESRGGDYYFWDSDSNGVYLVYGDDIDNPRKRSDNLEEFFKMLNGGILDE